MSGETLNDVLRRRCRTYDRDLLELVLVYHQRATPEACTCGWSELGRSHVLHILDVYELAVGQPAKDPV